MSPVRITRRGANSISRSGKSTKTGEVVAAVRGGGFSRRYCISVTRILYLLQPGWRKWNEGGSTMCDYSLHTVRSRAAKVGDRLVTRDFKAGTRGFAAPEVQQQFVSYQEQSSCFRRR